MLQSAEDDSGSEEVSLAWPQVEGPKQMPPEAEQPPDKRVWGALGPVSPLSWRTVLAESRMCWRRYTINLALDCEGVKLSDEMLASLDAFEETIAGTARTLDFLMREGDLLFSDNTRTVHARTPIAGGDGASDRLMIRSWIRTN